MNTIDNLREPKEVTRKVKDENGNFTEVTETKMVARPPKTVGTGTRFGYYLIDIVFFYILVFFVHFILALAGVYDTAGGLAFSNFVGIILLLAYYFTFEFAIGATPGKLILGYTVIDDQAERPGAGKMLGRTFARLVPFEGFSCLSERGWHDSWSNTCVVKKSEKEELRRLLGKMSNDDILD